MIFFIFFVFIGAAFVSKVATHCGRRGGLWAMLSLAVSGVFFYGAMTMLDGHVAEEGMDLNMGYVLLVVLAPIVGHLLVALAAFTLPISAPRVHEGSWRMRWIGARERDADTSCRVYINGEVLAVEPERASKAPTMQIPFSTLLAKGDGEALRLSWDRYGEKGRAIFMPLDAPDNRDAARRQVQAIATMISRHESSATTAGKHPYR